MNVSIVFQTIDEGSQGMTDTTAQNETAVSSSTDAKASSTDSTPVAPAKPAATSSTSKPKAPARKRTTTTARKPAAKKTAVKKPAVEKETHIADQIKRLPSRRVWPD